MIRQWYVQLLILILVWIVLTFLKSTILSKKFPNFKRLDIFSLFLLVAINFLSEEMMNFSLVPFIICVLSAYGLIMALYDAFSQGQIIYKRFLVRFWRITDLLLLVIYFCLLIFKIYTFLK